MNKFSDNSAHVILRNSRGFFPKELLVHNTDQTQVYIPKLTTTLELSVHEEGTYGHTICNNCKSSLYTQKVIYCPICGAKVIKSEGNTI